MLLRFRTLFSLFAAVLIGTVVPANRVMAELPSEFAILVQEAENALFDGDYEEAIRVSNKAIAWAAKPDNRRLLIAMGIDWTVQEALQLNLQAQAQFLLGNDGMCRVKLERARKQLEQRRTLVLHQLRMVTLHPSNQSKVSLLPIGQFFLYHAYIKFTEGDLDIPVPDLGIAEGLDEKFAQEWAAWKRKHENAGKAMSCYRAASDAIQRVLGLNAEAETNKSDMAILMTQANRALLNLHVSLAKAEMWGKVKTPPGEAVEKRGGCTKNQVRDAQAHLVRAEELLNKNPLWTVFVAPNHVFPFSYRWLQDAYEQNKQGGGGQPAANPGQQPAKMSQNDIVALKKTFSEVINDYMTVMSMRAEAAAYLELFDDRKQEPGDLKAWKTSHAERCYQEAVHLLRSQYRSDHPTLLNTELSKARWLAIRSTVVDDPGKPLQGVELRHRVSMARDCLFLIGRIFAQREERLTDRQFFEIHFIELRALQNLLDIQKKAKCFTEGQIAEVEERIQAVNDRLNKKVAVKPKEIE